LNLFRHSPPERRKHGAAAIHIVPDDAFDDWIVRDEDGQELGHFPTSETAELAAETIALERQGKLVIHRPDGTSGCRSFAKGWRARLFGS
jgi:hypothetical protein